MAKKPTKRTQRALFNKIAAATRNGKPVSKLYKQWCDNDRKMRKAPKPPKAKGAKR